MSKKIILLNDTTDHGGTVTSADPQRKYHGRPIARLGDTVECPHHGKTTIVEGDEQYKIGGIPVALEGHKTSCGAVLVASEGHTVG